MKFNLKEHVIWNELFSCVIINISNTRRNYWVEFYNGKRSWVNEGDLKKRPLCAKKIFGAKKIVQLFRKQHSVGHPVMATVSPGWNRLCLPC